MLAKPKQFFMCKKKLHVWFNLLLTTYHYQVPNEYSGLNFQHKGVKFLNAANVNAWLTHAKPNPEFGELQVIQRQEQVESKFTRFLSVI